MNILLELQKEFGIKKEHVENIINLIDEGNTIPFIARYRKELTGSLDDQILRSLNEKLNYFRNLNERREQVRELIREQKLLTDEIENNLNKAVTLTEVDDIYRPFRPKRRTKATIAKEKGLEPLAEIILLQKINFNLEEIAKDFIDEEKNVFTIEEVISGGKDIVAEIISDNAEYRNYIRKEIIEKGFLESKAKDVEKKSVYEQYYDYQEPIKTMVDHRLLALNRGEKENFLNVKVTALDEKILEGLNNLINLRNKFTDATISEIIEDSYSRLIFPSIEREVRNYLTENAEEGAIKIFNENLRQLLLQPPVKGKNVLALDPGFRTGCKFACIDETGKVLETGVVYCTPPQSKIKESKEILIPLIKKYKINIIAIGNGTASRETELFVSEMLKGIEEKVFYIIVNEAGASVYSASKLGAEEFPELDVALRSAASIGRRLQDPLAELVKIDPQSIGVGQYQHDINQKKLKENLAGVVEASVNSVGVELNTASASLLSYVAGISSSVSKNIIEYREEKGRFTKRQELLEVKGLGPKTFKQCAGFLRIIDSKNALDNTGVHPESYKVAKELIKTTTYTLENIQNNKANKLSEEIKDIQNLSEKLGVGVPTLKDIIKELEKPGRDVRDTMPTPILRSDVINIDDLEEGMVLQGTVRNVIDFGVFVDIGVHHDGLVHVSEISDSFIKHPLDVLSIGDIINVSVMSINIDKKRIALTMRGIPK